MRPRIRQAALLGCALAAAGCVRLGYGVTRIDEPLDAAVLSSLQPGVSGLGECLGRLGAPQFVWEYRGDGVALGWVWLDGSDWDLDMSYTFGRLRSASLSFDWDDNDLPGAVLWFDEELRLLEWRKGRMRDLTSGLRRPAPLEDFDR